MPSISPPSRLEYRVNDFAFFFRSGDAEQREAMGTPERAQRSMQAWMTWVQQLEANGHLKDPGQPLERDGKVVRGKTRIVTGGPFVEVKDIVLGFMIVEARDLDDAVSLASSCPVVLGGGSVEVRPVRHSYP